MNYFELELFTATLKSPLIDTITGQSEMPVKGFFGGIDAAQNAIPTEMTMEFPTVILLPATDLCMYIYMGILSATKGKYCIYFCRFSMDLDSIKVDECVRKSLPTKKTEHSRH